jgi:hypothetical protein
LAGYDQSPRLPLGNLAASRLLSCIHRPSTHYEACDLRRPQVGPPGRDEALGEVRFLSKCLEIAVAAVLYLPVCKKNPKTG